MNLNIVGGPLCGTNQDVHIDKLVEGQEVRVDGITHFYNRPTGKPGRLIYYTKLKDS